jgi:hypothetical protein
VGQLDQFAKEMFAAETQGVTGGAAAYLPPSELNLSEVRLDGMLRVLDPARLASLPAPWSEASEHGELVLELKMQGDHLDMAAIRRSLLRRQAREIQRAEDLTVPWDGEEPIWVVASHVPAVLAERRRLRRQAPGCYSVDTGAGAFSFLWIAANELPLCEELIPFLIARTGRALDEFGRWVKSCRPPQWLLRVVEFLPMSTAVYDEMLRYMLAKTDDPEVRARQKLMGRVCLEMTPELSDELVDKGLEPLAHLFERRMGRRLRDAERRALHERLHRLGPERLGDVVLDLAADQLAAWLADPDAR